MSMINDVKKVLRDTGVEMDADDVTAELTGRYLRYRAGLTRDQVSGCLARLRAGDVDITRTRPGLYQYRPTTTSPQPGPEAGSPLRTGTAPVLRRELVTSVPPRQLVGSAPFPRPMQPVHTPSVRPVRRFGVEDLDSLRFLDQGLFGRPIPKVDGRGNSHTLRRQARAAGQAYADRWTSLVNDQARDLVTVHADPESLARPAPGRLDDDLLAFADRHHLDTNELSGLAGQVRIGFWSHFLEARPSSSPVQK